MFFNKNIVASLIISLFFCSCGLEINEEAVYIDELDFQNLISNKQEACEELDYEQEIKRFFTETNNDLNNFNNRVDEVIFCLKNKISDIGELIRGDNKDYLTRKELKNLLNNKVVKEGIEDFIEKATLDEKFDQFLNSKNIILNIIRQTKYNYGLFENNVCSIRGAKIALHKEEEINTFFDFLDSMKDWLKTIESSSHLFYQYLEYALSEEKLKLLKESEGLDYKDMHQSLESTEYMFLENFHNKSYYQSLGDYEYIRKNSKILLSNPFWQRIIFTPILKEYARSYSFDKLFNYIEETNPLADQKGFVADFLVDWVETDLDKYTNFLYSMYKIRSHNAEQHFSQLDVKYFLTNLHLVEMVIRNYDFNDNGFIERSELNIFSCLFSSLIFIMEYTPENIIEEYLTADKNKIFNYILKYQKIPSLHKWHFAFHSMFIENEEVILSRGDLAKLFYVMLNEYFPKEYFNTKY